MEIMKRMRLTWIWGLFCLFWCSELVEVVRLYIPWKNSKEKSDEQTLPYARNQIKSVDPSSVELLVPLPQCISHVCKKMCFQEKKSAGPSPARWLLLPSCRLNEGNSRGARWNLNIGATDCLMEMERDAVVRSAGSLNMETRKPEDRSISHTFMCIIIHWTENTWNL